MEEMMQNAIITIFCYVDDFLKSIDWKDDPQCAMTSSEVMTTAVISWRFFSGNLEAARGFLCSHRYIPNMLTKSRLNRRMHAIPDHMWQAIVEFISEVVHPNSLGFLIDSFPVSACHLVRSNRRMILQGREFVGYNASKKGWFVGVKIHVLTTLCGCPKTFAISPGSNHDLTVFKKMYLGGLTQGATVIGDKAYLSASNEQDMEKKGFFMLTERRANSVRGPSLLYHRYGKRLRKRIETMFSRISNWLPHHVHAVTKKGFFLKLTTLIVAFSTSFLG